MSDQKAKKSKLDFESLSENLDLFEPEQNSENSNKINESKTPKSIITKQEKKGKENLSTIEGLLSFDFGHANDGNTMININKIAKKIIDVIAMAYNEKKLNVANQIIFSFYDNHKQEIDKKLKQKMKNNLL